MSEGNDDEYFDPSRPKSNSENIEEEVKEVEV
jgi:hypothetical protein